MFKKKIACELLKNDMFIYISKRKIIFFDQMNINDRWFKTITLCMGVSSCIDTHVYEKNSSLGININEKSKNCNSLFCFRNRVAQQKSIL